MKNAIIAIVITFICSLCQTNMSNNVLNHEKETENSQIDRTSVYFFDNNEQELRYKSYESNYLEDSSKKISDIKLEIIFISDLDKGSIFEIKFEKPRDSYIDDYRYDLGIFYFGQDKIYRIKNYALEDLSKITTEQNLLINEENFTIVCQEEVIEDQPEIIGQHNFLDVDDEVKIYRSYNNQVETGYYERIVWEKEKGFVGFLSGFGAESNVIKIVIDEKYLKYVSSEITWR